MAYSTPSDPRRMVGWYNPPQLLRTGALVIISQQFALHADNREIQAIANPGVGLKDYAAELPHDEPLWLDFVADCGDGWNSTYAVASALSQESLHLSHNGQTFDLERARILIFGGDLVYPTPTGEGYEARLIQPYLDALPRCPTPQPDVWALPGNHDWYDSLVRFRRLFCTGGSFGCWRTQQKLSYFAMKLPHHWWLFGVDVQLLHDLDHRQLDYFTNALTHVGAQDGIILCGAEPYWIERATNSIHPSQHIRGLFETLLAQMGDRLKLAIAGDLHYYRRMRAHGDRHLVTCGTGGAFLHPTHVEAHEVVPGYEPAARFPDKGTSKGLTWHNLLFPLRNPLFGVVPAAFYLLVAWSTGLLIGEKFAGGTALRELGMLGLSHFWQAVTVGIHSAILSPIGVALYMVIFSGFIIFTNTRSTAFRWIAGTLHGLTHVLVGFLIFWGATYLCISVWGFTPKSIDQYLLAAVIIVAGAWISGSLVVGIYLLISLNFLQQHVTEAFSSLRIQDWKGFLRMQLRPDGQLNVFFVGIRRVPRHWREAGTIGPRWISNDSRASQPTIEDRFDIKPENPA
jgi:Calcineurin-like phosphoesterase